MGFYVGLFNILRRIYCKRHESWIDKDHFIQTVSLEKIVEFEKFLSKEKYESLKATCTNYDTYPRGEIVQKIDYRKESYRIIKLYELSNQQLEDLKTQLEIDN